MLPQYPAPRILVPRVLILAGLILCSSVLRASIIYSNFDTGDGYSIGAGLIVTDNSFDYSVAAGFTPSADYTLTSVNFVATRDSLDSPDSMTISIFGDSGGHPGGSAFESFTLAGQTVKFGSTSPVLTVTSLINPVLHANTLYWVEMDGPLGSLIWNDNTTLASGIAETDGQGSWLTTNATPGVVRVNGDAVTLAPEPRAWWLMAGGLAALARFTRRRTQRSSRNSISIVAEPLTDARGSATDSEPRT